MSTDAENCPSSHMLEFAPGLGLRYLTPFGPLRLDVANSLLNPADVMAVQSKRSAFVVQPTPWSVHCNHANGQTCILESRVQYHLSIGEAF